ncbi:hypothetical protein F4802DRAFT_603275 [Xylaria palmicola]|nr:hypothetical protein F4802DRAFT_603275 [Xylaria palmicola]
MPLTLVVHMIGRVPYTSSRTARAWRGQKLVGSARTRMRFDEALLGDHDVTFVDKLWVALVVVEAGIILAVLAHRTLEARNRKARERAFSFSTPGSPTYMGERASDRTSE